MRDERLAYAAEYNPRTPDGDKEDVPYRGVINQDPLLYPVALERVPGFDPKNFPKLDPTVLLDSILKKRELQHDSERPISKANDPRSKRSEYGSSDSEQSGVPLFAERKPTPYSYNPHTTASGYPSDKRQGSYGVEASDLRVDSKNRESRRSDRKPPQTSSTDLSGSSDVPNTPPLGRESLRYSSTRPDIYEKDLRTSLHEAMGKRPIPFNMKAASNPGSESYSALETGRSRPHSADETPVSRHTKLKPLTPVNAQNLPSPSATPGSRMAAAAFLVQATHDREPLVRSSSPSTTSSSYPPSPPKSPRMSAYNYSRHSSPQSGLSTRPESRSSSRPASPGNEMLGISMPSARYDILQERSRPQSRLASTIYPPAEILDPQRPVLNIFATSTAPAISVLPYPDEDVMLMPSEYHHTIPITSHNTYTSTASQLAASMPSEDNHAYKNPYFPQNQRGKRTSMPSSYPTNPTMLPVVTRQPDGQFPMFPNAIITTSPASMTSTELQHLSNMNLPAVEKSGCRKLLNNDDYDDWYALKLKNVNTLYMCPECFDSLAKPNPLKRNFEPLNRQSLPSRTRCDFTSTWMRMALLLDKGEGVVAQDRHKSTTHGEMYHVHKLAKLASTESPCPGENVEAREWYTVFDERRKAIERFDVCPHDVARFEILLPNLRGTFQRNPVTAGRKRKCDLRISSQRFIEYFDMLGHISEGTYPGQRQDLRDRDGKVRPDITPFVEFVRNKAQTRECTFDRLLYEVDWHYPSDLPEFTICHECFATIVWPAIQDSSSVASKFDRAPRTVPGECSSGARTPPGRSCQLYSPRMRKVFKKAVQRNSFDYLARKALERRKVELDLMNEREVVLRQKVEVEKAMAMAGGIGGSEHAARRRQELMEQLEDCDEYWAKWE